MYTVTRDYTRVAMYFCEPNALSNQVKQVSIQKSFLLQLYGGRN
jgi:hypothetical protein